MRFPQLTFFRFIAAVAVVIYHFGRSPALMELPLIGLFMKYANGLLSYFFILTGFTIVVSLVRNPQLKGADLPKRIPTGPFMLYRLTRTYPLYLLALVAVLLLQVFFLTPTEAAGAPPIKPLWVAVHALMLQAWYLPLTLIYNYPSWYISADTFLCLLFPALYVLLYRRPTAHVVAFALGVQAVDLAVHVYAINHGMARDWGVYFPLFHLADFVFGIAAGLIMVRHYDALRANRRYVYALMAVLGLGLVGLAVVRFGYLDWGHSAVMNPFFVCMIVALCLMDNGFTRLLSRRVFQYLGEISYGYYMWQAPVSIVLIVLFDRYTDVQYRYVGLILLPVLLLVAMASYEWIEKPIKNWTKRLMKPRRAVTESVATVSGATTT